MKLHFLASIQHERQHGEWKLVYIDEGEVSGRGWGIFKRGLEASLPQFEHVWVQSLRFEGGTLDHLPADARAVFPSGVITDNIIGMASRPQLEQIDGKWALTGWFRPATEKMATLLAMASEAGKLGDFGLSINGDVTDDAHVVAHTLASGRTIDEVLVIDQLYSTDMVTYPGRGGGFSDVLASAGFATPPLQRGTTMTVKAQLEALLQQKGIAYTDAPAPLGLLASIGITAAEGNDPPEGMNDNDQQFFESIFAALTAGMDQVAQSLMALMREDASKGDPPAQPLPAQASDGGTPKPAATPKPGPQPKPAATPLQASTGAQGPSATDILLTKLMVNDLLTAESALDDAVKTLIASKFNGCVATSEDIRATIDEYKTIATRLSDQGRAKHYTGARVLASTGDKLQQACDQLFGVVPGKFREALKTLEDRQAITPRESQQRYGLEASSKIPTRYEVDRIGLRELYVHLTGDTDISFDFSSPRGRTRLLEASTVAQSTLPYAVGVSLNRRLIQDWIPNELPWRKLCRVKSDGLKDFRPQEIIRVNGWSEWADVPEGDAFQELSSPTEVKETYTPSKKGNLLPISREMFMRDDVRLVDTLLMMFRLAGQNTFHKSFFRKLTNFETSVVNDGTMGDGYAVYESDHHANILASAINHTNMLTLKRLIRAQKAGGSDIWLQLQGKYVVIPLSLEDENLVYITSDRVPGDVVNDANVLRIKEEDAIVIDDGLLDSSSYMYMSVDPTVFPTMEVGFINNQQVPEIFVQNDPTIGNTFTKDAFTWKGRYEFGIGWEDYRGVARLGV